MNNKKLAPSLMLMLPVSASLESKRQATAMCFLGLAISRKLASHGPSHGTYSLMGDTDD